jgi:hypothetical protein
MKTMKHFNKLKKASALLLLPVMGSAMATDVTVPLSFTTLPVITITEITPMAFGDVLSLTQADTCTMSTTLGTAITAADEGADLTDTGVYTNTGGTEAVGELSGNCSGDDAQPGLYEITSFADADITVSVTVGVDTDIGFTPIGYVTNLLEASTPTRETLAVGTDADVNATAALSAYANAGTNRAVVGGTITNLVTLTAGAAYATDFNLNVVYQ